MEEVSQVGLEGSLERSVDGSIHLLSTDFVDLVEVEVGAMGEDRDALEVLPSITLPLR